MRLSDLVAGLDISVFPSIGLVLFGLVFLAVLARAARTPRDHAARHAAMPLEEGAEEPRTRAQETRHV